VVRGMCDPTPKTAARRLCQGRRRQVGSLTARGWPRRLASQPRAPIVSLQMEPSRRRIHGLARDHFGSGPSVAFTLNLLGCRARHTSVLGRQVDAPSRSGGMWRLEGGDEGSVLPLRRSHSSRSAMESLFVDLLLSACPLSRPSFSCLGQSLATPLK
jgi:hypothetical protein